MVVPRALAVLAVSVPPLALAAVGTTHPHHLTADSASWWTTLHIVLLPVFPLLGVAHWVLLRGLRSVLAWVARIAAFSYICFYGALDAINGIGAGTLVQHQGKGSSEVRWLFEIGNELGTIGAWSFLVAAVAGAVALALAYGSRVIPGGVILVAASVPFLSSHIYWPTGVLTMCAMALGFGLLAALAVPRRQQ